jgi:excisionase family DNA binding protein
MPRRQSQLLTIKEACEESGLPRRELIELLDDGEIGSANVGRNPVSHRQERMVITASLMNYLHGPMKRR